MNFFCKYLVGLVLVILAGEACSQAAFSVPATACKQTSISVDNTSNNTNAYVWDFCQDALLATPVKTSVSTPAGSIPVGLTMEYSRGNWFGFVCNRESSVFYRLDFGGSHTNTPVSVDLGNPGTTLNGPSDISLFQENGNWFGLVANYYGSNLVRLSFGNNLGNTPTATNLGNIGAWNNLYGVDIAKDGNDIIALVTSGGTNTVSIINFGSSILNNPTIGNVISVSDPLFSTPMKISVISDGTNWYGLVTNIGGSKVVKLSFGTDLFSTPVISNLATISLAAGLELVRDGTRFVAFVENQSGELFRFDFDNDLSSNPVGQNLGNFGTLGPTYGISIIKTWPDWSLFTIDVLNRNIHRFDFSDACLGLAKKTSTEENPEGIFYTTPGEKTIELLAYDVNLERTYAENRVTILDADAPEFDIASDGICLSGSVEFTAVLHKGLTLNSWYWTFGDNGSSIAEQASHQYSATGSYVVSLIATASDGCFNSASHTVVIKDAPVADFTTPSGPLCSNSETQFVNDTQDAYDGFLTFQWYVDDEAVSTDEDLTFTFTSGGVKEVRLQAIIPGCSHEVTKSTSTVQLGPEVNFVFDGQECANTTLAFESDVSEAVLQYDWNFDDGLVSDQPNPSHTFLVAGEYEVSLTAFTVSGCESRRSQHITIYSQPQPHFQIAAPPSSCSGAITQFHDETPSLPDSEVSIYQWTFGDPGGNISSLTSPNFIYQTAGEYLVSLTVTTDQGCSNTFQKSISILPSPAATLSNSATCVGVPATFTAVGDDIKSYYWEIGTSFYTSNTTNHTFATAGPRTVRLTVEGMNECVTTYEKVITVPAKLIPYFTFTKNCTGVEALFTDMTSGVDPIVERLWNFHGLGTSNQASASFIFNSTGEKNVTLSILTQGGCTYTADETVTVIDPPVAAFTADTETGAMPLHVQFTNQSTGATSYLWTFETADGDVNSAGLSPMFTFEDLGDFDVRLIVANDEGCEDEASKVITVQTPLPDIDLKLISVSENPDGTYKVIITVHNKGNTVVRNLPIDVDISGNFSLRENIEGPIRPNTMYNLVLDYGIHPQDNLEFLCATADLAGDLVPEGNRICKDFESSVSIVPAYPNPANDLLRVEWIATGDESVRVTLIDSFGKKIRNVQLSSVQGLNRLQWDVSDLNDGIFILTIEATSVNGPTARKTQRILVSNQN
jgi:PKD repeat protein